jgi:hypothetical protein
MIGRGLNSGSIAQLWLDRQPHSAVALIVVRVGLASDSPTASTGMSVLTPFEIM